MSRHTPGASRRLPRLALALSFALALLVPAASAWALAGYPDNFNPTLVISDYNWRNSASMSQSEIQAFLAAHNSVLTNYSCAEGGPSGQHLTTVKPASQIIAEAAQYYNLNPRLIITTLEKEQSLITGAWHEGTYNGPYPMPSGTTHGTGYHLTNAMGVGCYPNSKDTHPGFGDQVWTGAAKLAAPNKDAGPAYAWYPGKPMLVNSQTMMIYPENQVTWNLYTYTPYYPQWNVWRIYNQWFGDPRIDAVDGRIHRFYNKKNGAHFFTASASEAQRVARDLAGTYMFEGAAYSLDTTSGANGQPLYRFYRAGNGTHFYTVSPDERDSVIRNLSRTYKYEGPAYLVSTDPENRAPVYRFYNRQIGSHFYTIDPNERDYVIGNLGWKYTFEGVAYYVALAK